MTFLSRLRTIGWAVVEAAVLLIILCLLLNIILGSGAGAFVSGVAANATEFLQRLPAGVLLGVALLIMLYALLNSRLRG